jgi:hypothetical protein
MAIKTIKFQNSASSAADGANGVVLGVQTNTGAYPTAVSGITAGFSPDNAAGLSFVAAGVAAPFDFGTITVASGSGARLIRIDRAAGTFTIKLQVHMPDGQYASTGLRVLDTNGTTPLFAQTVVTRTTDGLGAQRQINTDNSLVAIGTADAGQSITTSGASFFVELSGAGSFFTRLSYIEFDDGVVGGGALAAVLMRRRSI